MFPYHSGQGKADLELRINDWKTRAPCEVFTVILSSVLGPGWIPDPTLGLGFLSPSGSCNGLPFVWRIRGG